MMRLCCTGTVTDESPRFPAPTTHTDRPAVHGAVCVPKGGRSMNWPAPPRGSAPKKSRTGCEHWLWRSTMPSGGPTFATGIGAGGGGGGGCSTAIVGGGGGGGGGGGAT